MNRCSAARSAGLGQSDSLDVSWTVEAGVVLPRPAGAGAHRACAGTPGSGRSPGSGRRPAPRRSPGCRPVISTPSMIIRLFGRSMVSHSASCALIGVRATPTSSLPDSSICSHGDLLRSGAAPVGSVRRYDRRPGRQRPTARPSDPDQRRPVYRRSDGTSGPDRRPPGPDAMEVRGRARSGPDDLSCAAATVQAAAVEAWTDHGSDSAVTDTIDITDDVREVVDAQVERARFAAEAFRQLDQAAVDRIVDAMVRAGLRATGRAGQAGGAARPGSASSRTR